MPGSSVNSETTREMELTAGPTSRKSRKRRWWAGGVLLAVGCLASAGLFPQRAGADRPSRDEVEAAYLYNFGKFIRWPAGAAQGPLTICVAAQSPLAPALSQLATGEQIGERPLQVRSLGSAEGLAGCSILFIGSADPGRVEAFLRAAAGKPILTVGDAQDFLVRGGAIQFVLMEDHVRFSVNLSAADRSGLGLSSELLKVAVSVTSKPEKGAAR